MKRRMFTYTHRENRSIFSIIEIPRWFCFLTNSRPWAHDSRRLQWPGFCTTWHALAIPHSQLTSLQMVEITFSKWKKKLQKSLSKFGGNSRNPCLTPVTHFLPTPSSAIRKLLFTGTKQRIQGPATIAGLWCIPESSGVLTFLVIPLLLWKRLCSRQVWPWGGSSPLQPCCDRRHGSLTLGSS